MTNRPQQSGNQATPELSPEAAAIEIAKAALARQRVRRRICIALQAAPGFDALLSHTA